MDADSLDATDVALLRKLEGNGRLTYQRISSELRLSRTAIRERARRLFASGTAQIRTLVHPGVCGLRADACLLIDAGGPPAAAAAALAALPSVYSVQTSTGDVAVIARIRAHDDTELIARIDQIRELDHVRHVRVFRTLGWTGGPHAMPPLQRQTPLDEMDWDLIELLQHCGRARYSTLADAVGLSHAAARVRVLGLMGDGVIRVVAHVDPAALGLTARAGFAFTPTVAREKVAASIATIDGVREVTVGWGPHDVMGELAAPSPQALADTLGRIHAAHGVTACTSWSLLQDVTGPLPINAHSARPALQPLSS